MENKKYILRSYKIVVNRFDNCLDYRLFGEETGLYHPLGIFDSLWEAMWRQTQLQSQFIDVVRKFGMDIYRVTTPEDFFYEYLDECSSSDEVIDKVEELQVIFTEHRCLRYSMFNIKVACDTN